jgi:hypothetical protein
MSAEYLRSYLRAIDETPLEMQLGVTQLTNQDFEAIGVFGFRPFHVTPSLFGALPCPPLEQHGVLPVVSSRLVIAPKTSFSID